MSTEATGQRDSRHVVVYAAIAANVAIAVTKFIAAAVTGSSAMLSEGIHSVVDTGDGLLILLGLHLSRRPPDRAHPFGHGKEIYFWSLLVALAIFALGGGMSLYEGIRHLAHPAPMHSATWNYVVLGAAAVFEGTSWTFAMREFRARAGRRGVWEAVHGSKDPTTFLVLFEDSAALVGLAVAALGVALGHALRNPYLDGAASVVIGLLLTSVSLVLAYETRGLLVGEGADPQLLDALRAEIEASPAVERMGPPLTMYFGPRAMLLALAIRFRRHLTAVEVEAAVDELERSLRSRHPEIRYIYIEAEALTGRQRATPAPVEPAPG